MGVAFIFKLHAAKEVWGALAMRFNVPPPSQTHLALPLCGHTLPGRLLTTHHGSITALSS